MLTGLNIFTWINLFVMMSLFFRFNFSSCTKFLSFSAVSDSDSTENKTNFRSLEEELEKDLTKLASSDVEKSVQDAELKNTVDKKSSDDDVKI